jgi:acyl carrier protein
MTDDITTRMTSAVLNIARAITQQEVDENLDPLSAGLDSIATMELAARIEEELGVPCSIEEVFETPSLAALGRTLADRADQAGVR